MFFSETIRFISEECYPYMHIILAWRLNLFFLQKNAGTAPFGPAVQMSPFLIAFVSIR